MHNRNSENVSFKENSEARRKVVIVRGTVIPAFFSWTIVCTFWCMLYYCNYCSSILYTWHIISCSLLCACKSQRWWASLYIALWSRDCQTANDMNIIHWPFRGHLTYKPCRLVTLLIVLISTGSPHALGWKLAHAITWIGIHFLQIVIF